MAEAKSAQCFLARDRFWVDDLFVVQVNFSA